MATTNVPNPLIWPCGQENMGGYTTRVVFVPACICKAVPMLPKKEDITDDNELVTAKGAFEFIDASHKPTPIIATDKTVAYNAENQGEVDGRSFTISGSYFYPGEQKVTAAHARKVNNTPGYLVLETIGGDQLIVGQPGLPVSIAPAFAGGQGRADRKGTTFAFTADSVAPYVYLETPLDLDELFAEASGVAPDPGQG